MEKQKSKGKIILISIIVLLVIVAIIVGAILIKNNMGGKNKKLDVPYYGKITIGDITVDMYSTDDEMLEAGFKGYFGSLQNPNTDDEFEFFGLDKDEYRVARGTFYNDLISSKYEYGLLDNICKYVKLPKNITYESTVDDVKKEYGEPNEIRDITSSSVALGFINGNFSGKKLTYKYEADETNSIELELYFEEESQKLFMIEYEIHGNIN